MSRSIIHYTLNTGDSRQSPRSEVADDVIDRMRPLLAPGVHSLAALSATFAGYQVRVPRTPAGYVATVMYGGTVPLVTMAVADTPEAEQTVWPEIERMYLMITDRAMAGADFEAPRMPRSLPWLAVVILSAAAGIDWLAAGIDWLGDFERCLAWAWLERDQ